MRVPISHAGGKCGRVLRRNSLEPGAKCRWPPNCPVSEFWPRNCIFSNSAPCEQHYVSAMACTYGRARGKAPAAAWWGGAADGSAPSCACLCLQAPPISYAALRLVLGVHLPCDNFKEYQCDDIIARRAINSKKPGSTTTEVIIYN